MADHRANAVGAVSLTCRAHAIEICLVRVASFAAGFAPAAVAEEATLEVPYTAVRGLARRGRALLLAFDPAVVTPYNRFTLVRFGDRPLAITWALEHALPAALFQRFSDLRGG